MKSTVPIVFASLFVSSAWLHAADAHKPNILLIYTDDHGWADLGLEGVDKDIRTPNMDQLARDGVRFSRGYVSAPQCMPSRAGVLTGRYQEKFGVEDNNKGPLPLSETTIAERLKPAGYISGFVGKSHLDLKIEPGPKKEVTLLMDHLPNSLGFDEYFRGEMRRYYASHGLDGKPFADAPHLVADDRFRVQVQTEAALSFLDRRAKTPAQPWFLYLAWYAPHVPLESPEPWFSQTPANLPKERRQALAMIAAMDDGLGKIRARLRGMGAEKDTIIFCIGDNGAPLKAGAWNGSLNAPLIGEKGMLTDGGTRTPFFAAWPGTIPAGQTYGHPVINLDVAATANALAGLPRDEKLDGVNLMPFLTGADKNAPHDFLFWRWRSQAAVLEFPWKLIVLGDEGRFLFNVTNPEGELAANNQSAAHPEITARLEEKLKTWCATLSPPGPPEASKSENTKFFESHLNTTAGAETKPTEGDESTGTQDWLGRNCTLQIKDGSLVMTPEAPGKATGFLTHSKLDLPGPVTLTLRGRTPNGGKGSVSWRVKSDSDFPPGQTVTFDWPAGNDWQDIKVELPVQGRLVHLRIKPSGTSPETRIQSITLKAQDGTTRTFRFDAIR